MILTKPAHQWRTIWGGGGGGGGGRGGGGGGQKPLNDSLSKRRFCQHGRQIACVRISV